MSTGIEVVAVVKQIIINRAELAIEDFPIEFTGTETPVITNSTVPLTFVRAKTEATVFGDYNIYEYSVPSYARAEVNLQTHSTVNQTLSFVTNKIVPVSGITSNDLLGDSTTSEINFGAQTVYGIRVSDPNDIDVEWTTPGTYTWTCPDGVTSVSVVAVGAGGSGGFQWSSGGGGGGGLGWKNNISVTPGNTYTVVVGDKGDVVANANNNAGAGGNSYFVDTATVCGFGAGQGGTGSTSSGFGSYGGGYTGDGGGVGGNGAVGGSWTHGGGGAGGYSGNGASKFNNTVATGGAGGAGQNYSSTFGVGAGGGVGIYGEGTSGVTYADGTGFGGRGGSGGGDGMAGQTANTTSTNIWERSASVTTTGNNQILGGQFGGGGGGSGTSRGGGFGGTGAVRLIAGVGRSFPSNAELSASQNIPGTMDFYTDVIYNSYEPQILFTTAEKTIYTENNLALNSLRTVTPREISIGVYQDRDSIEQKIASKDIMTSLNDLTYNLIKIVPTNISISVRDDQELGYFVNADGTAGFAVLTDSNDPRGIQVQVPGISGPVQIWY
jgi:hypothetical protein